MLWLWLAVAGIAATGCVGDGRDADGRGFVLSGLGSGEVRPMAQSAPRVTVAPPPPLRDGEVVARLGRREITLEEVDARWRENNAPEFAKALQALYDGRRKALDSLIGDALIERAAAARNVTPEEWVNEEHGPLEPVTDADVVAFLRRGNGDVPQSTRVQLGPVVKGFLEGRKRLAAREQLAERLRDGDDRHDLELNLEPPRYDIEVTSEDPALGTSAAPVTLVEFADFECPFCRQVAPRLAQLKAAFGDRLRIVWKDFPLSDIHPTAQKAAHAARCALDQGAFWKYHDVLFASEQLSAKVLMDAAETAGVKKEPFARCVESRGPVPQVARNIRAGVSLGIEGTPTLFINGRRVEGLQSYEDLRGIVEEELQKTTRTEARIARKRL
jgi:predicted DsbA family dithiol-disulfide isomerase